MTELYMKVAGRWHRARKTVPDDILWDRCRHCSLRRSCNGKSERNSLLVDRACAVWGLGFNRVTEPPVKREPLRQTGEHPMVAVETVDPKHGSVRYKVDVDIAPLTVKLNMMGVRTWYSCQGNPGEDMSAYVVIDGRDESKGAVAAILRFWKGRTVYRSAFTDGGVGFYMADRPLKRGRGLRGRRKRAATLAEGMELVDPREYKDMDKGGWNGQSFRPWAPRGLGTITNK